MKRSNINSTSRPNNNRELASFSGGMDRTMIKHSPAPKLSRRQENIITPADYEELNKAYQFVLPTDATTSSTSTKASKWQDRMVEKYHSQLYKSHVLADMTRYQLSQIGLRWRTKQEVLSGKGFDTCGNKHCISYFTPTIITDDKVDNFLTKKKNGDRIATEEIVRWSKNSLNSNLLDKYEEIRNNPTLTTHQSLYQESTSTNIEYNKNDRKERQVPDEEGLELKKLQCLPHGIGIHDYEVHFAYIEHGKQKNELVKLRLCLRCAPLLFCNKGGAMTAKKLRMQSIMLDEQVQKRDTSPGKDPGNANNIPKNNDDDELSPTKGDTDSSLSSSEERHRKRKKKKRRRRRHKEQRDKTRSFKSH